MLRRQSAKRAIWFAVELDENVIPDLQHVGIILIDKMCSITPSDTIVMYFTANVTGQITILLAKEEINDSGRTCK